MSICIVAVNLPPVYSGAGIQALTLAREFRRQGHDVVLITRTREGLSDRDRLDGFDVYRVKYSGNPYPGWREAARQLLDLARTFFELRSRYRAVMFFGPDGGLPHAWLLLPLLHAWGKRTVTRMTMLDSSDPSRLRRRRFGQLRLLPYRLHHGAIALSTALAKSYTTVFHSTSRLVCITNGVDVERFRPLDPVARAAQRAALGFEPRFLYCATVGRISTRKGIDTLIEAWCDVAVRRPDARLVLIGPERDEYRNVEDRKCLDDVRTIIAEHNIGHTVIWTGHTESVERYLQCADIFVFTSRREGCPNALVEAMASGLPIVTTNIPDITTDLVTAGQDALLVSQDAGEVANALLALIDDRELRVRLGVAARRRAVEQFAIPVTAQRYLRVLGQA